MLIDSVLAPFVSVTISLFALVLFLLIKFSSVPFFILAFLTLFSVIFFLALFFIVCIIQKPILEKSKLKVWSKWKITLKDFLYIFSDFFRKNKKGVLYLVVLSFFGHMSILLEIFLILSFLDISLDVIELAVIEAGYTFAFLIPVSQALGTAEATGAYTLQALGHSAALGISLTLILRIRHLLVALIGIAVLIFYGLSAFVFSKGSNKGEK